MPGITQKHSIDFNRTDVTANIHTYHPVGREASEIFKCRQRRWVRLSTIQAHLKRNPSASSIPESPSDWLVLRSESGS